MLGDEELGSSYDREIIYAYLLGDTDKSRERFDRHERSSKFKSVAGWFRRFNGND